MAQQDDPLATYRAKRDFGATPEPAGGAGRQGGDALSFVVQKHDASRLHYDFRLEFDGTLKSWAVPKGPSMDPAVKRLAVEVEDHPLDYGGFEGTIPEGHYGAGTVIVWDRGRWKPLADPRAGLRDGKLEFELEGDKLRGRWVLVRTRPRGAKPSWLLIKSRDDEARAEADYDVIEAEPDSVLRPPAAKVANKAAAKKAAEETPAGRTAAKKAGAEKAAAEAAAAQPADGEAPGKRPAARKSAKRAGAAKATPRKAAKSKGTDDADHPAAGKRPAAGGDDPPARPAPTAGEPRITHPERVIDERSGVTKGALADYYRAAAPLMLPHLAGRPLSLLRAPRGVGGKAFFQRHAGRTALPGVDVLDPALDSGGAPLLGVGSAAALMSAVQMNVVEFHTWNATVRRIDQPDRLVFDLDPGEGVAFGQVREAASLLRALLDELGLACWLKTSGGKGLHLVVPHAPRHGWEEARGFARSVVEHAARVLPDRFVARSGAGHRVGRVYIDPLRNGWGATTVSAWSARAREGLGVSVPVGWDELDTLAGGAHWTVAGIGDRLAAVGNAPWDDYPATGQSLIRGMKKIGFDPGRVAR